MISILIAKRLASLTMLVALLSSCASDRLMKEGDRLTLDGRYEEAMATYERAGKESTQDWRSRADIRIEILRKRVELASRLVTEAQGFRNAGDFVQADKVLQRALSVDPSSERGHQLSIDMSRSKLWQDAIERSQGLFDSGEYEQAETLVTQVLFNSPRHPQALGLKRLIDERRAQQVLTVPRLRDMYTGPISVEFKDASVKQIFEGFSRTTGLNFILDREVRGDLKSTIFLKNTGFEEAIDLILLTTQLEKRLLSKNTILIFPAGAAKQKEYQDLLIRAFYLSHHEAKLVAANLKAMLKLKDVQSDDRLNAVFVRDTPDVMLLVERFIAMQDLAEPEVMLELDVIEVSSNRLLELGIQYPSQFSITPLNSAGKSGAMLLNDISGLNRSRLEANIGSLTVNARKSDGWSNTLANPRIRAKNKEKAKILIGDRVPVITTTTSQGVVAENIQYIEVGVKLEVEPTVYLQDDVSLKLNLEVSSLAREIRSPSGALAYQIGTRSANTTLRLKDGETQILGGLITNDERSSAARIPGLGDLPVLGRLFGTQSDTKGTSELLLAITPRLVRNLQRPAPINERMWTGTENQLRTKPLYLSEPPVVVAATGFPRSSDNPIGERTSPAPNSQQVAPTDLMAQAATAKTAVIGAGLDMPSGPKPPARVPEPRAVDLRWGPLPSIKANENFQVILNVESDGGLTSLPLQLSFDRSALEVLGIGEGDVFRKDGGGTNFSQVIDASTGIALIGYSRTGAITTTNSGRVMTVTARFLNGKSNGTLKLIQATPITETGRTVPIVLPPTLDLKLTP
jgi:general secretion pathway protein D